VPAELGNGNKRTNLFKRMEKHLNHLFQEGAITRGGKGRILGQCILNYFSKKSTSMTKKHSKRGGSRKVKRRILLEIRKTTKKKNVYRLRKWVGKNMGNKKQSGIGGEMDSGRDSCLKKQKPIKPKNKKGLTHNERKKEGGIHLHKKTLG